MERTCPRGHVVAEEYLKACPACGAQLGGAVGRNPSLAPAQPAVRAPRTVPFIVGAVVLALFGGLLNYAAEQGAAEDFSYVLILAAIALLVLGVVDGFRRR
ncbi:hypothetical protein D9V37_12410 [Nocardioides mangrovicus]|uniref:Uncharacterized protein n=1 Tax=Nocardioides mangrovicus TaxID=2478913 RepID=A0A3L8P1T5_9ACTN|nr:hypothetical protein [Nocardioides mangrovicus]RLV49336.1 hypothetical protein D9V37_12410 [Nocardioides mangrovicus]